MWGTKLGRHFHIHFLKCAVFTESWPFYRHIANDIMAISLSHRFIILLCMITRSLHNNLTCTVCVYSIHSCAWIITTIQFPTSYACGKYKRRLCTFKPRNRRWQLSIRPVTIFFLWYGTNKAS